MAERMGELLVKRNFITPDQLKKAMDEQKFKGGRLESILVKLGFVKEDDLYPFSVPSTGSLLSRFPKLKSTRM